MFTHINPRLRKKTTFLSPEWFRLVFTEPEFYLSTSIDEFVKEKENITLTTGLFKPSYAKDGALIIFTECQYQRIRPPLSTEEITLLQDKVNWEIMLSERELEEGSSQDTGIFQKCEARIYEIMKGGIDAEIYDDHLTRIPIRTICTDTPYPRTRLYFPWIFYSPQLPYCELIGHTTNPTAEQIALARIFKDGLTIEELRMVTPFMQKGRSSEH